MRRFAVLLLDSAAPPAHDAGPDRSPRMTRPYAQLLERFADIRDLSMAQSLAGWDQEVVMPPGGADARAHVLAALAGAVHGRSTDRELVALTKKLWRGRARLPRGQRRQVELARRAVRKARRIPSDLARDLALAESRGLEAWREARNRRDWKRFVPSLEHIVQLKRRVAKLGVAAERPARGSPAPLYDALLDDFEPGLTSLTLDPLLAELRAFTVPLLKKVVSTPRCTWTFRRSSGASRSSRSAPSRGRSWTPWAWTRRRSRMDLSTHPFCSGFSPGDVRITGRFPEHDLRGGLFGIIHEAGHGIYEQGLDPRALRHAAGQAPRSASTSRSRGCGRTRSAAAGRSGSTSSAAAQARRSRGAGRRRARRLLFAINDVQPSFIRVEADEATYNLHIILRFELEQALHRRRPGRRRRARRRGTRSIEALLGLDAAERRAGLPAGHPLEHRARSATSHLHARQPLRGAVHGGGAAGLRSLPARIARGDMAPLREWLREHIHRHDNQVPADVLVKRVTGRPLEVRAFAEHLRAKAGAVYGV